MTNFFLKVRTNQPTRAIFRSEARGRSFDDGFKLLTLHQQLLNIQPRLTCLPPRLRTTAKSHINPSTLMITDIPLEHSFNIRHSVFNLFSSRIHKSSLSLLPPALASFIHRQVHRMDSARGPSGGGPTTADFRHGRRAAGVGFSSGWRELGPATSEDGWAASNLVVALGQTRSRRSSASGTGIVASRIR
jgi:hypothetical protein